MLLAFYFQFMQMLNMHSSFDPWASSVTVTLSGPPKTSGSESDIRLGSSLARLKLMHALRCRRYVSKNLLHIRAYISIFPW
jgi:hypothetical protein